MLKSLQSICLLMLALSLTVQRATATVLSDAAAALEPGEWVEVDVGLTNEFLETIDGPPNTVLHYADTATWDGGVRQFRFVGQAHYSYVKFITYDDATNAWSEEPVPYQFIPPGSNIGHAFDHNTIDPDTGDNFFRPYNSKTFYRYERGDSSWTTLPTIPSGVLPSFGISSGVAYFPEMDGVVFVDGKSDGRVVFWSRGSNQWSVLADSVSGLGRYSLFAEYTPKDAVVVFGGASGTGARGMWKLTSAGTVVSLNSAPVDLGVANALFTTDPVSGNFIVFAKDYSWREYNVSTDSWTTITHSMPPIDYGANLHLSSAAAPISTYGVLMYINYKNAGTQVWLYKHATSDPECNDGGDNDGDGLLDLNDPGCGNDPQATDETNCGDGVCEGGETAGSCSADCTATECGDGVDNDGDGKTDTADEDCYGSTDPSESPCSDGSAYCETQCADSAVIRCVAFEDMDDLLLGNPHPLANGKRRIFKPGGDANGTGDIGNCTLQGSTECFDLDTTHKTSGSTSLRFQIPTNSSSDSSGSVFFNFQDDFSWRLDEGEDVWIAFRYRINPAMLHNFTGGDGWKVVIVGNGDYPGGPIQHSCTTSHVVIQQDQGQPDWFGPFTYHSCGNFNRTQWHNGTCILQQDVNLPGGPFCCYNDYPGGCWGLQADEWMTVQMHLSVGAWNAQHPLNNIEVWMGNEGQPLRKTVDTTVSGTASTVAQFWHNNLDGTPGIGKVWLLPYHTGKDSSEVHPTGYVWYDDLVISTSPIYDVSTPDGPPAPPKPFTTE